MGQNLKNPIFLYIFCIIVFCKFPTPPLLIFLIHVHSQIRHALSYDARILKIDARERVEKIILKFWKKRFFKQILVLNFNHFNRLTGLPRVHFYLKYSDYQSLILGLTFETVSNARKTYWISDCRFKKASFNKFPDVSPDIAFVMEC